MLNILKWLVCFVGWSRNRRRTYITDFFDQDMTAEIQSLQKQLIETTDSVTGIQNKINRFDNLSAYRFHLNDLEIRAEINGLQAKALPYADMTKKSSYNSFPGNYLSKVFELAIFKLLKETQKFELCSKKPEPPDFIFLHDSNEHYLECVTSTSSLMDKFFEKLPKFSHYVNVSEFFDRANKKRAKEYGAGFENALHSAAISILIHELDVNQLLVIKELAQVTTTKAAEDDFIFWIYLMRYSRLFFRDLLSETVLDGLRRINLPEGLCGDQSHDKMAANFILNNLARSIVDKSNKNYFKYSDKPITLAISFSLGRDFLSIPNLENMMCFICQNLKQAILKQKKKILDNEVFNNLYAIIIDCSWYNWFPEIAIKRHNAQFPDNFNNCYGCIYNTGHALTKQGTFVYDKIPFVGYFE